VIDVLVCDDVAEMRMLIREALEREPDLRVVGEAHDASTAAQLVARLSPDVVMLDLDMPGADPDDLVLALRSVARPPAIVVFSGYGLERLGERAAGLVTRALPKTTELQGVAGVLRAVAAHGRSGTRPA